jgi:hypothetical protein
MATKVFCDACGNEGASNKFSFRFHLNEISEGKHLNGYLDRDRNPVSGRDETVELCNKCYNIVVMPSVAKLKELQKK